MKFDLISKLLLALVLSQGTLSASWAAKLWKNEMPVVRVQSLPDGGFIIYGPDGSDPACSENGKLFYVQASQNGQTASGAKNALAVTLTAFSSGKTITFYYDNGSSFCYINTVLVNP